MRSENIFDKEKEKELKDLIERYKKGDRSFLENFIDQEKTSCIQPLFANSSIFPTVEDLPLSLLDKYKSNK